MFAKVLILALALGANAQLITKSVYGAGLGLTGGVPVYRSSANYGGLAAANGWGYGANLGRVAGVGALRTGAILGGGALGYGTGALVAGGPAVYGAYGGYGGYGLGGAKVINTGLVGGGLVGGYGLGAAKVVNTGLVGGGLVGAGYGLGLGGASYGLANLNIARGVSVHQAGPVNAAVQTVSRTVDYRPVPYVGEPAVVQDVDVPPQESPLRINFQSKSSPLQITQGHIPAEPGQVQVTQSEDEPQTAIHNVNRPVVQQVNEVIQPYRTLTQTVEPVIEQTHTNIAQGEGVRLTGLTSGVVGGTGVIGASGVGVAGLGVGGLGVARYGVAGLSGYGAGLGYGSGLGVARYGVSGLGYGTGLGYGAGLGYGVRSAAVAPAGLVGIGGLRTSGLYGGYGLGGVTKVVGSGLGYGSGLSYGTGLGYGSYGYGSGLGLSGLSGLTGYGTTTKIARFGGVY